MKEDIMAKRLTLKDIMTALQNMEARLMAPKPPTGIPATGPAKPPKPLPPSEWTPFMEPGAYVYDGTPSGNNPMTSKSFRDGAEYDAVLKLAGVKVPRAEKYLTCDEMKKIRAWEAAEKAK